MISAAAVWWQLPGSVMDGTRTVVEGSVGKVGFLVPLALVWIGWRNMRDPEHNGPAGRHHAPATIYAIGPMTAGGGVARAVTGTTGEIAIRAEVATVGEG